MLTKYEVEEEEKTKKIRIKPKITGLTIHDVNRLYDMYSANVFEPPTIAYARGVDGTSVAPSIHIDYNNYLSFSD